MRPVILIAESSGFSPEAVGLLEPIGEVRLANLDRCGLLCALACADVLWVRLRYRIDTEVLEAGPHLRAIATPTTGLNHIALEEAARRGVRVLSLQGEAEFLRDVHATAEHTLALALALLRNVPCAVAHVHAGGWQRDLFRGRELYGKTVGIVGYGRLGRMVAPLLSAFGARVLASDPYVDPASADPGIALVSLGELLARSELVSLHVNLNERTRGFFGRPQFDAMRAGAWFVNTARGELVDEDALLDALVGGRLAGAAVDVLSGEKTVGMRDHKLVAYALSHSNLLITPHVAGCTLESMHKTECFLAQRVVEFLARDVH